MFIYLVMHSKHYFVPDLDKVTRCNSSYHNIIIVTIETSEQSKTKRETNKKKRTGKRNNRKRVVANSNRTFTLNNRTMTHSLLIINIYIYTTTIRVPH